MTSSSLVVLKFGGTSVSTKSRWETIRDIALDHIKQGRHPFVVCSALSGISNLLDTLLPAAVRQEHEPILEQITARHVELGEILGVDARAQLAQELTLLARVALGASLLGEVTPKVHAQVMATGELMSTKLGAAFLSAQGHPVAWRDARDMLRARREEHTHDGRHFLASSCVYDADPTLRADVLEQDAQHITLTQGFIARDDNAHTVLLGRGGSDTSAAYFAAKLGAQRLEIWTDVPGMFTADPRQVPSARLLRKLTYFEAQELATTGAKVLHPRCIEPVRQHDIPLYIRCTPHPEMEGTLITSDVDDASAKVKAISAKRNITLISMETVGMWQQVGFLSDVFASFKRNGLSIDLVATSETNVTVSLDPVANALDEQSLSTLMDDLQRTCQAKTIDHCAAISLVGRNIRAILHRLGPVFETFEEQKVYMMSQASSDLNLTFVVDAEQVDKLVRGLHAQLFQDLAEDDEYVGPTWRALFEDEPAAQATGTTPWWVTRRDELLAQIEGEDALYVYDTQTLEQSIDALKQMEPIDAMHYAVKANTHPEVLRQFEAKGMRFECVSWAEVEVVFDTLPGLSPQRVLFTPNFAPIVEYIRAFEAGVHLTLDNVHPLAHHPEVFRGRSFIVRVDPGEGKGHHKHVRTAGYQSKFGILPSDLERVRALADAVDATIIGLHTHVGSGIRSPNLWGQNAQLLAALAADFKDVRILNLGGGLGVPEKPGDTPLDLDAVARTLGSFKTLNPDFELWMEPGRYCVAQAGVLLARVTQLKGKDNHHYVGVATGMNTLIRPSLYGAYHHIVNLTNLDEPACITADIVGPICESGDVLGYARRLPSTSEGDVLLIATTGAYGRAMSSHYNARPPASEVLI